jgi:hypothetical protein
MLVAEPDHIFVKPPPNLAPGDEPAAFPFFYIEPSDNEKMLRKLFPEEEGNVSNIDPLAGDYPEVCSKCLKYFTQIIFYYFVGYYSFTGKCCSC